MREPILLVDDEPLVRNVLKDYLWMKGYYVLAAENGAQALNIFSQTEPALVLLDLQLPDIAGLGLLAQMKLLRPQTPVLIFSGRGHSVQQVDDAIRQGAAGWIAKSFTTEKILWEMQRVLARRQ